MNKRLPVVLLLTCALSGCVVVEHRVVEGKKRASSSNDNEYTIIVNPGEETRETKGNQDIITGSGRTTAKVRHPGTKFTRVESSLAADLRITNSGKDELKVEAEENILSHIKTTVTGDTLKISATKSFTTHKPIKIELNPSKINALTLTGTGDAELVDIKEEGTLEVIVAGSADVKGTGQVGKLAVTITGSGDCNLSGLKCRTATVTIAGSGDAKVNCTESLDGSITGSGDISYRGHPAKVEKKVLGSGDISQDS
jgi:hypothetical protein